ncbi:MAG: MFS transporter [Clostridia bacterium]|nr:MFS transporter [Clostridia bacterium]
MKKYLPKDEYYINRPMYVLHAALAYFITLITSGAYLAKLTTTIGISDEMTAVLSAVTSLAGVFQLLSIPLASRARAKRTVIPLQIAYQLLYAALYLIPFLGLSGGTNSAVFFVCIFLSLVLQQVSAPLKFNWFMGLVPSRERPAFQSVVQIFSHISGLAFTFTASWLIDRFEKSGNLSGMFITFSAVILVISLLNMLTLIASKEKETEPRGKQNVFAAFSALVRNRGFLLYLLMYLLNSVGTNLSGPFLGTYQIKELGLSMVRISVFNAITVVTSVSALTLFGRLSKKKGMTGIMLCGFVITALSYTMVSLAAPGRGFLFFCLYYLIHAIGGSATSIGIDTMLLDIVGENERVSAIALRSVIIGPIAFLTTIVMTPFLSFVQGRGNVLFGIPVYAQQIMGALSCVVILCAGVVYRVFASRQKK